MYRIMLLATTLLLAVACSKENKVNRRLNGTWLLVEENNMAINDGSTTKMTFEKDGKEGQGMVEYKDSQGNNTVTNFSYMLDKNVLTTGSNMYTVLEYTKTDLVLSSTNGVFKLDQRFKKQ